MAKILAVVEQREGALRKVSNEVVGAARAIGDAVGAEVHAVLLGPSGVGGAAGELGRYGADRVLVVENDALAQYSPEVAAATIAAQADGDTYAIVFAASAQGRDLAPRVAAKLDVPLAADVTAIDASGGELNVTRPVYSGRAFATLTFSGGPRLVSIRPNVFRATENAKGGVVDTIEPALDPSQARVRVREVKAASGDRPDVGEAAIVVSGGRGMKGPESWNLLEDLRDALGMQASLGASRAVVDAGWRPHAEQVGQTGKTVSPQLYFAVGISGAMQHLAGMRSARTIVAINKDPDAPIFKVADYGIVGDAQEILPKLTEAIRSA
ncbi:MAG TPA: electron transfer flavoprotein subunit alpha/FixB family protein [Longimicrobiales bacterium]|nr:electron transfer flavoprotein subunit alpha/FixB family protein [Longimicrobiales bacterium]